MVVKELPPGRSFASAECMSFVDRREQATDLAPAWCASYYPRSDGAMIDRDGADLSFYIDARATLVGVVKLVVI